MIEPEIEETAPAATDPDRQFRVFQVTFVGDEQNGSSISLVEGSVEEAQLFMEGWTRAAYELYQNFGTVPAAAYPPAAHCVPGVAESVRDAIA